MEGAPPPPADGDPRQAGLAPGRPPDLVAHPAALRRQLGHRLDADGAEPDHGVVHLLPGAGAGRQRQRDHLDRRHHRGHVQGARSKYPPDDGDAKDVTDFTTQRPAFGDDGLTELLLEEDVTVNARPPDSTPVWQQLLLGFGPTLLIIGLLVWSFRRMAAGGGLGGVGGIGRSRAKRYEPEAGPRTTFDDVAGIDEVEEELAEVVDFLRNPDKYRRLGAAIPKGVLLSGPPGTGKTLLARAVAGEAQVPFFYLSASEFIEMIVGVGASRVRDLFETAKKAAPAIIFIDELDAIGRARGGGSHRRRRRARADAQPDPHRDGRLHRHRGRGRAGRHQPAGVLDPALLRPGRFDRRVAVSPPDSGRSPADPRGAHPQRPARAGRRPGRAGRDHPRHGRRRPAQPGQRGRADRRPARPGRGAAWPTSPTRWRRSCSAPRARS